MCEATQKGPMPADESDMKAFCQRFWNGEQGQDLVEYMLLLAFVVMACAGVFFNAGGSMNQIWTKSRSELSDAAGS
jgi:Flp pilus assembly pilin Flp